MLHVGDKVPDFTLPLAHADGKRDPVAFSTLLGHGPVVVAFYPLAFSGICTNEACDVRDGHAALAGLRAKVVGFSTDTPHTNVPFAKTNALPYALFSDPNREVVDKVWATMTVGGVHRVAKRGWMIVSSDGRVVEQWASDDATVWSGVKAIEAALAKAK